MTIKTGTVSKHEATIADIYIKNVHKMIMIPLKKLKFG